MLQANRQRWPTSASSCKDKLEKYENERRDMAQRIDFFNIKPPRKSNSSYDAPEDLIDLEPPMEVTQKKKPQLFSMTPRPLHPDTVNEEWEMHTEGLTEKEVNLRCFKLLDSNLELQRRREPDRPPKKADYTTTYDGMNEREINLRFLKALEKNSKIAKHGPPGSSPPSSSSSSSGDSDTRSDRVDKKAKKVRKDRLKTHPKFVKDVKLPPLPEAPEFDLWKDKVYHKIVTAAQRGSIIHPWIVKIEKPEVTFDDSRDIEGYDTLDAALCCAIFEVAKGELFGTLTLKSRELRTQGRLLTGRQALFMVYAEFAIDEERGALYDLSDLMLLRFKSDDQAPRFVNLWQHTVQGFTEKQPDGNLMTLLKAQLENSPALKPDMAHFNRLPKGDPERTYDYLMTSLKRFVDTAKKKQNRERTLIKLSGGQQRPTILAVPAEEERDTNVCIAFQNTGSCRFGDRCRFIHTPGSEGESKAEAQGWTSGEARSQAKGCA